MNFCCSCTFFCLHAIQYTPPLRFPLQGIDLRLNVHMRGVRCPEGGAEAWASQRRMSCQTGWRKSRSQTDAEIKRARVSRSARSAQHTVLYTQNRPSTLFLFCFCCCSRSRPLLIFSPPSPLFLYRETFPLLSFLCFFHTTLLFLCVVCVCGFVPGKPLVR